MPEYPSLSCSKGQRPFAWIFTTFIAALVTGMSAPPCAARSDQTQATIIPLEPYADEHWAFKASIAGREETFLFDTGAGLTAITPQAASELGCEPWGQLTGFRMRGDRVDVQRCDNISIDANGTRIHFPTVGIWDLNAVLPKGAPSIAGNVGLDAFPDRVVTLDIPHRKLILETPASLKSRVAGLVPVPIHVVDEAEGYSHTFMAGLDTPKGRIWMGIDSGDDVPITVGRHVAALLGLDPQLKEPQQLDSVLSGGVPLRGPAYVKDIIFDGNIGAPILAKWIVTVDLAGQHLWIKPASLAPAN